MTKLKLFVFFTLSMILFNCTQPDIDNGRASNPQQLNQLGVVSFTIEAKLPEYIISASVSSSELKTPQNFSNMKNAIIIKNLSFNKHIFTISFMDSLGDIYYTASSTVTIKDASLKEVVISEVKQIKSAAPSVSIPSGVIPTSTLVSITAESDTEIYYTIDGTDPTSKSTLYTTAIEIQKNLTLKAIAYKPGLEISTILKCEYEVSDTITPSPIITPVSGKYYTNKSIEIQKLEEGIIYYTIDGSIPDQSSTQYSSPIQLDKNGVYTIKALAISTGKEPSPIVSNAYTIEITATENKVKLPLIIASTPEPFTADTTFQLVSETTGSSIYYTTDGSLPSSSNGTLYTTPFKLSNGQFILKAIAIKDAIQSELFVTSIEIKDNSAPTSFVVYFKKPATWAGAFIHYWQNPASPITNWNNGSEMTSLANDWYSFTFDNKDLVSNKISFLFKDAKGAPSKQTTDFAARSLTDDNWYFSDKVWYPSNPEELTAPSIKISPAAGSINGADSIKITITSYEALTSTNITMGGKNIALTNKSAVITVSDYITTDGASAQLEINVSNATGSSSKISTFQRDDSIESKKIVLYFEGTAPVFYAWIIDPSGTTIKPNGEWPGKALTESITNAQGKKWFFFDAGDVSQINFILNSAGGSDQARSQTGYLAADGKWYNSDPYAPSAPIISVNLSSNKTYKGDKKVSIEITALNNTIDSEAATVNGVAFNHKSSNLLLSDIIKTDNTEATIIVEASNSLGITKKTFIVKRDDNYSIPTGIFTWDNALVYFVLTDRFYDGNPSNNFSYGRKQFEDEVLNTATFHGGDVKGLSDKIKEGYFNELGINAIWMTAPYEQIHGWVGGGSGDFPHYAYHGYYALDWTMMDRNMGTVEEMREMVKTAHEHNIRVVIDIVLNHAGYGSFMDMVDYGFGSYDKTTVTDRLWHFPLERENWQSHHHTILFYTNEKPPIANSTPLSDWMNWWGPDWIRSGIEGHTEGDGTPYQTPLAGLPDIKTESTTPTAMAPIMKTKWNKETSAEYNAWKVESNNALRDPNSSVVPADFIIAALAGWVREFGIDGFRVDTAKHVKLDRWKQLKVETDQALKDWRTSTKSNGDPAKNWTESFWMTGEVWDQGVNKNDYYSNGFDSLINFSFPHKNGDGDVGPTWAGYAAAINTDPDFNVLTYINSHDMGKVGFFGKGASNIKAGTALVLSPGGVQIFYGDENDRPKSASCSDPDHPIRSDYQWDTNSEKLAHWNTLGQFRNLHFAVGAGLQESLGTNLYYREATVKTVKDKVVIGINQSGSVTIDVTGKWADGKTLKDFYTGNTSKVTAGKVTFNAHQNGVILISE